MPLTSSLFFRDRNIEGGRWRRWINFKGCSLSYCDAIYRRVLLFVCSMNRIPPYLFPSRTDDADVRDIGKRDFLRLYFILCFLRLTGEVVRAEALKSNYPEFQPDPAHHLFLRLRIFMPNELISVKLPPQENYYYYVSSVDV